MPWHGRGAGTSPAHASCAAVVVGADLDPLPSHTINAPFERRIDSPHTPRGVDLFSYLVPNQLHPWFGDRRRFWFMPPGLDSYPEFVASFSIIGRVIIGIGMMRREVSRIWTAFPLFFALLSLGPFIHMAGVNMYLLAPWGLLRYVPVIGMARARGRFAIVAVSQ